MLTLLSKGVPTKLFNFFWLKILFHLPSGGKRHRWSTSSCKYLRKFSKKFGMTLLVYSESWGKLIHKKTRSRKSPGTVPLRFTFLSLLRHCADRLALDFWHSLINIWIQSILSKMWILCLQKKIFIQRKGLLKSNLRSNNSADLRGNSVRTSPPRDAVLNVFRF